MSERKAFTLLLEKACLGKGLCPDEAEFLWYDSGPDQWKHIFEAADEITRKTFRNTLSFFAPLYFSNHCVNDCAYCGFRRSNQIPRNALTINEFLLEAEYLYFHGHRSVLLIGGEHPFYSGVNQIRSYIYAAEEAGFDFFWMAEIAPMIFEDYLELKHIGVQQLVLFQETYEKEVYGKLHRGPKIHFDWRLEAMSRALRAGFQKVGLGVLLGLQDPVKDLIEMIRHGRKLYEEFRTYPATFSFPRLRPAKGVHFPHAFVSDDILFKMIALTRLAFPESGIILSTRESSQLRKNILNQHIGVTHLSAGSKVTPGAYSATVSDEGGQFEISDDRSLGEVIEDVKNMGYFTRRSPEVCAI